MELSAAELRSSPVGKQQRSYGFRVHLETLCNTNSVFKGLFPSFINHHVQKPKYFDECIFSLALYKSMHAVYVCACERGRCACSAVSCISLTFPVGQQTPPLSLSLSLSESLDSNAGIQYGKSAFGIRPHKWRKNTRHFAKHYMCHLPGVSWGLWYTDTDMPWPGCGSWWPARSKENGLIRVLTYSWYWNGRRKDIPRNFDSAPRYVTRSEVSLWLWFLSRADKIRFHSLRTYLNVDFQPLKLNSTDARCLCGREQIRAGKF